ncbi:hypothetical protein Aperf_G00000101339 [Anoplocephala perfoliata]
MNAEENLSGFYWFLEDASRFIGSDADSGSFDLIPSTIHGLFNALNDQRSNHFYLTLSAVEVQSNTGQKSTDLFSEIQYDLDPEGKRMEELKQGAISWKRTISCCSDDETTELVAATVAEAAHYLDAALEFSRRLQESSDTSKTPGHLFFTFHVYRNHSGVSVTIPSELVIPIITKVEEKVETAQVRSPMASHSRRFKSRSGHKTQVGTITNELWVDGPNAITSFLVSPHSVEKLPHSPLRRRSESVSEREKFSGARGQTNTADKGIPDGKAFDNHENFERKLESRMRKLDWSNEPLDSAKIAKQLEALLTPRFNRKFSHDDAFRQTRQHKQIDQNQQTTITSDFPVMTNLKHDSFPAGVGGITRGVKPFVKQWVERQNQAFIGYCVEQPFTSKHGGKQPRGITKTDGYCRIANDSIEIPQFPRKHRYHESKITVEAEDILITPNDSASHSRSLPRQVTPDMLSTTQHHPIGPAADDLSRVARWVESVSAPDQSPPVISNGCSKHPLQCSPICKNCNRTAYTANLPKSPEITGRGSSAPAARFRPHHEAVVLHTIEDSQQPQSTSTNAPSDPHKPDGASDPGVHGERSFGSVSGLDTITEGLKTSPLRKPVLKRFVDLFVCSPAANRRRQQCSPHVEQPQHQQSGHVSKMCAPFFGGVSTESGVGEGEAGPEGDILSIDSVGMLFTSMSKGSGAVGDERLFLESEKTGRRGSKGNQSIALKHREEPQSGRIRIKEAGTRHRFGFPQSPLFTKRNAGHDVIPLDTNSPVSPHANALPSLQIWHSAQSSKEHQQQDSMAFHCQDKTAAECDVVECELIETELAHLAILKLNKKEEVALQDMRMVVMQAVDMRVFYEMTVNSLHSRRVVGHIHGHQVELRKQPLRPHQSDFVASAIVTSQASAMIPEVLTTSFTDTTTVSMTGDTMLASTASRSKKFP